MRKALVLAAALLAGSAGADDQATDLVKQLGSSHYPTRDAAMKALSAKTDQDTIDKLHQAMKSSDPEVARRAQTILRPYLDTEKEKRIHGQLKKIQDDCGGILPQVDLTGIPWEGVRYYMDQSEGTTCHPDWTKYRAATRLLLLDLLKDGQDVGPLIEYAKERENDWWRGVNQSQTNKYPLPYPPRK